MKLKFFSFLFLFPAFIGYAQSDQQDLISGHVFEIINDTLSPLPGVHVYYSATTQGTTTDTNGYFELVDDHSNYQLVFRFIGFQPDTLEIDHKEVINVVMGEGNILEDFEVQYRQGSYTFSKIDPRDAQYITQKELRKAACCNLAESFETNPSIDASFTDAVTGTKQIQMLGLSGKYVQTLSGNIPNVRGLSVIYGLKETPGAWINGISVSKGAGSVLNGYESMVGQINIDLKQPGNSEKFHLNIYGNQAGRIEGNAIYNTTIGEKWETTLLIHGENQTIENDRNKDGFLDNPLREDYVIQNQWNFRSNNLHMELGANYVHSNSVSGNLYLHDSLTPSTSEGEYKVQLNTDKISGFAKIGYLFPNEDFKSLAIQLSGTYNDQHAQFGVRDYQGYQTSGYANLIFQQEIGENSEENYYKVGASLQYDNVDETLQSEEAVFSMNGTYQWKEWVPGIYGEFTRNTEKLGLILGLRGDYSNIFGAFITPRLHLRYNINNETVIKLMAGSGRRTPFLIMENVGYLASSRNWILATATPYTNSYGLDQEISWNFGGALLKEFELFYREGTVHLDFYHTRFVNQLVVDLDESAREVWFYNLNGESISNSIQAELNYELFKRFDIRLAYRFLDVYKTYLSGLNEKPLLSRHRGFVNLAYETKKKDHKQWKFDLTAQWIGSQRIPNTRDNPELYALPGRSEDYMLMNAQVTRVFGERLEVYLGGENLLNYRQSNPILSSENPYGEYFESALIWAPIFGRMFYGGLRYTIEGPN